MSNLKYLAIHLPQFHPIPENDKWWGKGFTEWTNVVKAKPLFKKHYQPRLPADLGFYDLRLSEVREAQAEIAKAHGIDCFCYYHYWFNGRRILERPVNEIVASGRPNYPFCLFWANETWEGRWHGIAKENRILIKQEYSREDDLNHIRWLAGIMADNRYFKIGNRPIFIIYRPLDLPEPQKTIEVWRNELIRLGLSNPYLLASDSHAPFENLTLLGFDAVLQFLPQLSVLEYFNRGGWRRRIRKYLHNLKLGIISYDLCIYDYEKAIQKMLRSRNVSWPTHKSIIPSWDNSPRSGKKGIVLINSTPNKYEKFLYELSIQTKNQLPSDRQILFLNAWNEWAEGNYLEPDMKHGKAYLESVKRVKEQLEGTREDMCKPVS